MNSELAESLKRIESRLDALEVKVEPAPPRDLTLRMLRRIEDGLGFPVRTPDYISSSGLDSDLWEWHQHGNVEIYVRPHGDGYQFYRKGQGRIVPGAERLADVVRPYIADEKPEKAPILPCRGRNHTLQEIARRSLGYGVVEVVRWCSYCGGIVVDRDDETGTDPGRIMPFRVPVVTKERVR